MQYLNFNEKKQHGTASFPFEFYHVDSTYPRYIMNYHWHVEYEIIRILEGKLYMTLDEKEFTAAAGDIVFIHSGILHSGTPTDCVYECLVFDLNTFLKHNPGCAPYIQKIIDRSALIYHHFSPKYEEIHQIIWNVFDAMTSKRPGYELTTFGELYHFFGTVFFRTSVSGGYSPDQKRLPADHAVEKMCWNTSTTTIPRRSLWNSFPPRLPCRPNISAAFSIR